jgi:2-methylcitrate dehydratase PrpD
MMPARRPARVLLTLIDGRVLEAQALVNKGDFEDPYSQDDLKRKYLDLSVPVWGEKTARAIYELIGELENLRDMNQLTELIQGIR